MLHNFLDFYYVALTKLYIYEKIFSKINSIDTMFYFGASYFVVS